MGFLDISDRIGYPPKLRDDLKAIDSVLSGNARNPEYYRFVDANNTGSGNGKTWDTAFATITEGITELNTLSGKGATLWIAPGFYIEVAGITLSANDCALIGAGLPEDTVLFGSGTAGSVSAATDHLITVTGGNNYFSGLTFYVHKDDKACFFLNSSGGYTGSFNIWDTCYFSPQAQDGMGYCIWNDGGSANIIRNSLFEGSKVAAINFDESGSNNPTRNTIINNIIRGTKLGIRIDCSARNTLIKDNIFIDGDLSNEELDDALNCTAEFVTGTIILAKNYLNFANVGAAVTNAGTGTVTEIGNTYNTQGDI